MDNLDIIDDTDNGTSIHAIKNHLNNIGYIPNTVQDTQLNPIQQIQMMRDKQLYQDNDNDNNNFNRNNGIMNSKNRPRPKKSKSKSKSTNKNIAKLVSDINNSLDKYMPNNSTKNVSDDDEEVIDNFTDNNTDNSPNTFYSEFILLTIIYTILSHHRVHSFIGKYIKMIRCQNDGTMTILGLIIYGMLISVLYLLCKQFIA